MTPLVVLIVLLLPVSAAIVTAAREPFLAEGDKFFVRWENLWRARAAPSAQEIPLAVAASASPISSELERLHKMEADLANLAQQIEQVKVSQEQIIRRDAALADQFKANEEQLIRAKEKSVDQFTAMLEQIYRQNTAVSKQLKAHQEQLADLATSRATSFGRKHLRRNPLRAAASALQR
jgi:septal ring factor EnvC (AmiA/AmiB activator)